MLSWFRALVKSPISKVLIGLLIVSFGFWGIRDVLHYGASGDAVITAGSRTVSTARFKQLFQQELAQLSQQNGGQPISAQDALAHNLDRQIADALAADESMAAYITRIGVRPSDKQIGDEIAKAPRFFNPVTGKFDKAQYEQFVQGIGMRDTEFEATLRDELAQTQYVSGLAAGLRAPLVFPALTAAYDGEGRTFDYITLPATSVPLPPAPTDAAMNGFLKQNAAQLMRPEARVFTVVGFSSAKLAPTMAADPAEVQKRFDFEKDTLSTPPKASFTQIPVRTAAEGAAVAARLQKGENPGAVAASLHVQPIAYADSPKTAIGDKKIADIVFTMASDSVKGPVQGDFGLSVIKTGKIDPGHQATLDEVRPKIEAEVKADAARAQVNKAVQKFESARSGGSNLADAAKAAGAQVVTLPPLTAQGQTLQRQQAQIPAKVLQAGFALQAGQDSDIVDLGQGEYAALQLDKIVPPSPPPLEEVRPMLARFMMQQALMKALQAKADAIAAAVRKGQSMEAAAAANHATLGHGVGVLRSAANQSFSGALLSQVFSAKPGEVVSGPDVKLGMVVAKLNAVVPASGQQAAQATADARQAASQATVQDFAAAVRAAAAAAIKPKIDYAKARAAVGGADPGG
jgi:peptidyl-prolyl cis-trans isomerase D